jgi:hypothetical protein
LSYERDGSKVNCRAHVRIRLDERVQQQVRPYWEKLIELDYARDVAARRARHAAGMSTQWAAILDRLLAGPVPDGAARMTDEQLAAVVKDLLAERAANESADLATSGEYEREGYFDLLEERRQRHRPA